MAQHKESRKALKERIKELLGAIEECSKDSSEIDKSKLLQRKQQIINDSKLVEDKKIQSRIKEIESKLDNLLKKDLEKETQKKSWSGATKALAVLGGCAAGAAAALYFFTPAGSVAGEVVGTATDVATEAAKTTMDVAMEVKQTSTYMYLDGPGESEKRLLTQICSKRKEITAIRSVSKQGCMSATKRLASSSTRAGGSDDSFAAIGATLNFAWRDMSDWWSS